jgi:carboxymethylenebutenolidase
MTERQRYLAEEVAEDHADGIITRREAMRRLGLLGLGGAAATTMLTAFEARAAAPAHRRHGSHGGGSDHDGKVVVWEPVAMAITFPGPNGTLMGAWAPAVGEVHGAVLVIHENRGLTDHIRTIPPRFAADGYSALAVDLLSEEGGTETLGGDAQAIAALGAAPVERLVADMRSGIDELQRRVPNQKVGMIGFCFGGGMTWTLLAAGEPRLAAAAPFYGPTPANANFSGSKAAVLAVYGALDARVNGTRDAAVAALQTAGLTYEVKEYPDANHAFFNDTGASYNAAAATQAYAAVLDWYGRYLA